MSCLTIVTNLNRTYQQTKNKRESFILILLIFPPQTQGGWLAQLTTLSLSRKLRNLLVEWGLVMISAACSWEGIWETTRSLLRNFSLTKKMSSSMCLVRAWRSRLWAKATELWLSQKIREVSKVMWSSLRRDSSQRISEVTWARLRYSSSVVDLATKSCFLAHHETKLGPRKMQAPEVDLRSSWSAAQSASQNPKILIEEVVLAGLISKPCVIIPLRYLSIHLTAI